MAMNPALRCGHCEFDFDPPLEACVIKVGGGTGYDGTNPDIHYLGLGGSGVRVTDADGVVIHECGDPDANPTGHNFHMNAAWSGDEPMAVVTDNEGETHVVAPGEDWSDPKWR